MSTSRPLPDSGPFSAGASPRVLRLPEDRTYPVSDWIYRHPKTAAFIAVAVLVLLAVIA